MMSLSHVQKADSRTVPFSFVKNKAFIECKAVEKLCADHRQQLWNYMRLTKTRIGILWNFAPVRDQSEHYYLDVETDTMFIF